MRKPKNKDLEYITIGCPVCGVPLHAWIVQFEGPTLWGGMCWGCRKDRLFSIQPATEAQVEALEQDKEKHGLEKD